MGTQGMSLLLLKCSDIINDIPPLVVSQSSPWLTASVFFLQIFSRKVHRLFDFVHNQKSDPQLFFQFSLHCYHPLCLPCRGIAYILFYRISFPWQVKTHPVDINSFLLLAWGETQGGGGWGRGKGKKKENTPNKTIFIICFFI